MRTVIKKTKSFSPDSLEVIPAEVVEYEDGVYLEKRDEAGKKYKSLIEKDKVFYHESMKNDFEHKDDYMFFILDSSSKCNLNCSVCYEDSGREISLENVRKVAKDYEDKIFVLAGKEPTMRANLIDVIGDLSRKNFVSIATNGLKLENYDYLKGLKDAGLKHILFSLNGVDEDVNVKIHGANILKKKLAALENIKKLNIPTIISMTITRDINEDQIKKIFNYCIKNQPVFYEFRIRSMMPLGKHLDKEPFCLSDLIKLSCSKLGFGYEDVMNEMVYMNRLGSRIGNDHIKMRTCEAYMHVKVNSDGSYIPFGKMISGNLFVRFKALFSLYSPVAFNFLARKILKKKKAYSIPGHIRVAYRAWPNVYNIDLDDISKKCYSCRYSDSGLVGFCIDNIKKNFKKK